jgi:hypothetical protein
MPKSQSIKKRSGGGNKKQASKRALARWKPRVHVYCTVAAPGSGARAIVNPATSNSGVLLSLLMLVLAVVIPSHDPNVTFSFTFLH